MPFEDDEQGRSSSPEQRQQHHLMDWLEDSMSFLSSFLVDPYTTSTTSGEGISNNDITGYGWWTAPQGHEQADVNHTAPSMASTLSPANSSRLLPQAEFFKKRKKPMGPITGEKSMVLQPKQRAEGEAGIEGEGEFVNEGEVNKKLASTGRKSQGKSAGSSSNGGGKEARWAEQLLNPCATAIEAANVSRVRHLICVLQELQSFSGDANHRLAAHGLRALSNHLLSTGIGIPDRGGADAAAMATFVTVEPKLFRSALIKFNEVSPWFAFPNTLANASILQTLALDPSRRAAPLHVVDVGVSHGVQWPTFLDALARRPGSGPPLVRLTVVGAAAPPGPFSAAPPGYDFRSHLLRYAKSIDLNLQINHANVLGSKSLALVRGEILVICIQFRAGHNSADDRTVFLDSIRDLEPDLVVLSEIDGGIGSNGVDGRFPAAFAKKAELLWKFLDSTSAAFRGKDCPERQVMEGEAAKLMDTSAPAAEGRDRWRERMAAAGFLEEAFGDEAVESGRSLLRKYDGNWETRTSPAVAAAEGAVAAAPVTLWWKGRPVCFCSLWKLNRRS